MRSPRPAYCTANPSGLARLATTKYKVPTSKNISEIYCHLTNYSLNKFSEDFQDTDEEGTGSKRKVSWVKQRLADEGHSVEEVRGCSTRVVLG